MHKHFNFSMSLSTLIIVHLIIAIITCVHSTRTDKQNHPQEKEMQQGKMVVWGGLTNNWEKKRSERKAKEKGKYIPIWMQSSKE